MFEKKSFFSAIHFSPMKMILKKKNNFFAENKINFSFETNYERHKS